MKDTLPTGKSQGGTRNKFNAAHLRALACVIATAGLLDSSGFFESCASSANGFEKSTDSRFGAP